MLKENKGYMNDDKNVGQVIHNKRKELSLTQEDLAEKVHVTRQAVSNWERNKTVPDDSMIAVLAENLGTNIDNFVSKNNKKQSGENTMSDKENTEQSGYKVNKYDTAMGLFYAVALFIGILVALILMVVTGFTWENIIIDSAIGLLTFLILGLLCHAIITLCRKD